MQSKHVFRLLSLVLSLPLLLILSACDNTAQTGESGNADAPDFKLQDVAGGEVALSDFSGQPVLLYFHMAVG